MRNFAILNLLICLLNIHSSFSQESQYTFKRYDEDSRLINSQINHIFQDSKGFLWLGTDDGLFRYDGYQLKSYNERFNIRKFRVRSIFEDKKKNLWISTEGVGLLMLNLVNEQTELYYDKSKKLFLFDKNINNILEDEEGNLLVSTSNNGLCKYNPKTKKTETLFFNQTKSQGIYTIMLDHKNKLWVSTFPAGLYCLKQFNAKIFEDLSNEFIINENDIEKSIHVIYEGKDKAIWFGSHYLIRYDPVKKEIKKLTLNAFNGENKLCIITSICQTSYGEIWVGTTTGLFLLKQKGDLEFDVIGIPSELNSKENLNTRSIGWIKEDVTGNVWVGTDKGLYKLVRKTFESENISNITSNHYNDVMGFAEGWDNDLWIATWGNGLITKNKEGFKTFKRKLSKNIWTIYKDKQKNLWVATFDNGLFRINEANGNYSVRSYTYPNLPGKNITSVYEDDAGRLWVGAWATEGLFILDRNSGTAKTFEHDKNLISYVNCIVQDKNGKLWIGTRYDGLFSIENKNEKVLVKSYSNQIFNNKSLSDNNVTFIYESLQNELWIGTGGGLNKFNTKTEDFEIFTVEQGLPDNAIQGILEDRNGNLWISSNNGLTQFDPVKKTFINYTVEEGLQHKEFNVRACYKSNNGNFYFGGKNGYTHFQPSALNDSIFQSHVVFTELKILNRTIIPNEPYQNKRVILTQDLSFSPDVNLSYKDRIITFLFSPLNYNVTKKVTFEYKLSTLGSQEKDWVLIQKPEVSFASLEPGRYILKVRVLLNNKKWAENSIRVFVAPPFWDTIWFKISVIISIIGGVISWIRYRLWKLKMKNVHLEILVKKRTEDLNQQSLMLQEVNQELVDNQNIIKMKNEALEQRNSEILEQKKLIEDIAQREIELNKVKLNFFTNIAHEFRTPLTLILGPLQELVENFSFEEAILKRLTIIRRNANRLHRLINQFMDLRKLESGKLLLKVSEGDIVSFIKDKMSYFDELAKQNQINFRLICVYDSLVVWFDNEKIETVIFNILSNAFKFTNIKGSIAVEIKQVFEFEIAYLEITIFDSGKGIPEQEIESIFDKFYQVRDKTDSMKEGTGIGLALVKELVELHHGFLKVESTLNSGSSFSIRVPLAKNSYTEDEIFVEDRKFYHENVIMNKPVTDIGVIDAEIANKPTLLIVEDNPDLRRYITDLFIKDFITIEAINGKDGLGKAFSNIPDLIISDVMMPVFDGVKMCETLKKDMKTSHIPIILLTARAAIEHQIEGMEVGADLYIPKPFNSKFLYVSVQKLIENRMILREKYCKLFKVEPQNIIISSTEEIFLKKAIQLVEDNITQSDFGFKELGNSLGMSKSQMYRKLNALTGQTINEFINTIRLRRAAQLLKQEKLNISEVAYMVGFNDPRYFRKMFKEQFGIAPTAFVKKETL